MAVPTPESVREQLERILSSGAFTGASRHSRVLRYLVERTLAGQGDQLKEYVLGTEAFDRPDTYDPRIDSIVRVEVRRLRTRLEDYYSRPGASDAVLITIPRGAYVPVFERRAAASGAAATVPAAVTVEMVLSGRRPPSFTMIAAAVTVGIALIVGTLAVNSNRASSAQAATAPSIAILPFEPYSTSEPDVLLAAQITDAVTTELARLRTVAVVSRTSASLYNGNVRSMSEIVKALDVKFVMEASAVNAGDHVSISARLVYGVLDRKVWVGQYTFAPSEIRSASRQIAAEAAGAAVTYLNR